MRKKPIHILFYFIFFLVFISLLWGCDSAFIQYVNNSISVRNDVITTMELPQTPLFEAYPNYFLLTTTVSRLLEEKDIQSKVLGIVRKGDVWVLEKILGGDEKGYIWCFVRQGNDAGWVYALNPILTFSSERAHYIAKNNS